MNGRTGKSETVTHFSLHLPTVIAIALVAYALTNVAHEGLGHGGMCVAMGGEPRVLNAVYFECGRGGVTDAGSRWISAAGTLTNLAFAALTALLLRAGFVRAATGRYFLWLFLTLNLLQAFGYWMFSGLGGIGDWNAVVEGRPHYILWRIALAVVGTAAYWFVAVPIALRGLEPFLDEDNPDTGQGRLARAVRLTVVPYIAGGVLYVTAGLRNPESPWLVLISAAAASFGGASALAWMARLLRDRERYPPTGAPALALARSWPWLIAGAITAAIFIGLLGPGITLENGSLAQHPGGHRALVVDDGGLERIEELAAEADAQRQQYFGVHQVALAAVRERESAAAHGPEPALHSDARRQPAEEQSAGRERRPRCLEHGAEMVAIPREVQHGAADHDLRARTREAVAFDCFVAETLRR